MLTAPIAAMTVGNMDKEVKDLDENTAKLHTAHGVAGMLGVVGGWYLSV